MTYEHDAVIDRGLVREREKGPSRPLRSRYGHTPLSEREEIPWACQGLIVGTGVDGALPVVPELAAEAERRGVELVLLPTARAIGELRTAAAHTNAILHLTC